MPSFYSSRLSLAHLRNGYWRASGHPEPRTSMHAVREIQAYNFAPESTSLCDIAATRYHASRPAPAPVVDECLPAPPPPPPSGTAFASFADYGLAKPDWLADEDEEQTVDTALDTEDELSETASIVSNSSSTSFSTSSSAESISSTSTAATSVFSKLSDAIRPALRSLPSFASFTRQRETATPLSAPSSASSILARSKTSAAAPSPSPAAVASIPSTRTAVEAIGSPTHLDSLPTEAVSHSLRTARNTLRAVWVEDSPWQLYDSTPARPREHIPTLHLVHVPRWSFTHSCVLENDRLFRQRDGCLARAIKHAGLWWTGNVGYERPLTPPPMYGDVRARHLHYELEGLERAAHNGRVNYLACVREDGDLTDEAYLLGMVPFFDY
ncbi:hypothetical protein JCM10207_002473 [Rhodosporidiobolus poonsookiae]